MLTLALFWGGVRSGSTAATLSYIEEWKWIAMANQEEYGIPASITLAQGIHESASGTSKLAREGNNHFGIKCHGWSGERYMSAKGSCYRKYTQAEDGFCDHARILKSQKRYASLFQLPSDDFKSWASGLKKAGYASAPAYPQLLTKVINDYGLHLLDIPSSTRLDSLAETASR